MSSPLESARAANLLAKKFVHLEADDKLRFSCNMCGGCCKDVAPLLNSYDLLVLRRFMRTITAELLDRQIIELFFSPTSGLPRCGFVFQKAVGGEEVCPFLTPVDNLSTLAVPFDWKDWEKSSQALLENPSETLSGKLLGCRVHPARPTMCRSYPLGRALTTDLKNNTQEAEIILQEPDSFCKAHETDRETTVGVWLEDSGCRQYWEANDLFDRIMIRLEASGFGQGMVEGDSLGPFEPADGEWSTTPGPSIPQADTHQGSHPRPQGRLGLEQQPWPEDLFQLVFAVLYEFDETAFLKNEFPLSAFQDDHSTDMRTIGRIGEIVDLLIDLKKSLEQGNKNRADKLRETVYSLIGEL